MSNPNAKPQGRQRAGLRGYEKRDANAKWIFGIIAFLLVAGLIMHFCLAGMLERLAKNPLPTDAWTGARHGSNTLAQSKTIPHLQLTAPDDLETFQAREETELNTYGWIDRSAGVVRIPIANAMELILARESSAHAETNGLGPSSYELQQQRPQSPQPEIQEAK